MKKVLLIMLSILLPLSVSAMDYSSEFDIGDSVSVSFNGKTDSKNLIGFHVLNGSSSGETTVTLVYDGVLATHDASGILKKLKLLSKHQIHQQQLMHLNLPEVMLKDF